MTPHIQGGQGRSPAELEGAAIVMMFSLAILFCLLLLLIVNQLCK